MRIFESVNVKNKKYETGSIIRNFLEQTKSSGKNDCVGYWTERVLGDGGIEVSKLCYEASSRFGFYDDITGISFRFGGVKPYYVTYRALYKDGSLIINSNSSIIRNLFDERLIIPSVDPFVIKNFADSLDVPIVNFFEYAGKLIEKNQNNCLIVDNMSIRISYNDLTQGITDAMRMKDNCTKMDVYSSIGRKISEKRKNGKDLNWFMYKMLLLNKII